MVRGEGERSVPFHLEGKLLRGCKVDNRYGWLYVLRKEVILKGVSFLVK